MFEDDIILEEVYVAEEADDADAIETIQVVEIDDVEMFTVETDNAFAALGEPNEQLRHSLLNDRDLPDQHPITAITGLRKELDQIEALKEVQSNHIGVANYYEWSDGAYDEHGRFVSLLPHSSKIKICDGSDIFGVTVENAGFIGGQDGVTLGYVDGLTDTYGAARGNSYGLVATSGLVDVQCELDVAEGDYVVSNWRGIAEKTSTTGGYKVIAVNEKHGTRYASISLGVQACTTDLLSKDIQVLDERMDAAETNIVSAINVANQAYNKAIDTDSSNQIIAGQVQDALNAADKAVGDVENMGQQVTNASTAAAQAKAIADAAILNAEVVRKEAMDAINNALAETSKLRDELEKKTEEIEKDLNNTSSELEDTKQDILNTKDELQNDIAALEQDLEPLSTWPEGSENPTGIAGFVAQADANSVTLGGLVKWQGETNDSIAAFKQEVKDDYATQVMLSVVGDDLASFKQEVKDDYATQEMLTSVENNFADFKQEVSDTYATQELVTSVDNSITNLKQEVKDNYATQEMVSKVSDSMAKFEQKVTDEYATQESVTKVDNALTSYKQEVKKDYATNESLTTLRTDTSNAIAASEAKATDTYASKNDLTSFENSTKISMTSIEQKADANGAYIQSTVSNMDKYSVGPYSQTYGFTLEQAKSVLENGMIYVPTVTHTEEKPLNREFTKTYYCTWDGEKWVSSEAPAVTFSGEYHTGNDSNPYWYVDSENNVTTDSGEYCARTLYKWESSQWVAVATLKGNSSSRAVSQIRQDTNNIELSVTALDNKYAGTKIWVDDNKSAIQDTVSWHGANGDSLVTFMQEAGDNFASASQVAQVTDKDGNVTAASIVAAVNGADSSVVINADHIRMEGLASFATKADVQEVQDNAVYNTTVEYALSSSTSEFVAVTEWSTVAPDWRDDAYMWQKTTITKGDGVAVSSQTCIQGAKGEDGESGDTPYIKNGNWWVGTSDTGIKAEGTDGVAPTITIVGGYWYIDGKPTNVKAEGSNGTPAPTVVKVTKQYYLSSSNTSLSGGSWSDSPSAFAKNSYMWVRDKYTMSEGNPIYSDPVIDNTFTTISKWCMANNQTLIDGANIATGTITAEQINTSTLNIDSSGDSLKYTGAINVNDNFIVHDDGNVQINGNITWGTGNSPTQVVYCATGNTKPADGTKWSAFPATSASGWHRTWSDSTDYFASYTYDGGATWTSAVRVKGESGSSVSISTDGYWIVDGVETNTKAKGEDGGDGHTPYIQGGYWYINGVNQGVKAKGEDGAPATIDHESVFNALTKNGTLKGVYEENGGLYINADYIKSGTIDADKVTVKGRIEATSGYIGGNNGWVIDNGVLYIGKSGYDSSSSGVYLGTDGISVGTSSSYFKAPSSGTILAHNLRITGLCQADDLEAGGWDLKNNQLHSSSLTLNTDGSFTGTLSGSFSGSFDGSLSCSGSNASSTIRQSYIEVESAYGPHINMEVSSGSASLVGGGSDVHGIAFTSNNAQLFGNWIGASAAATASDKNVKYDIDGLSDVYEVLFDNLKPSIYKYADGTSGRTHTGFIAQDVLEAMNSAGLTTTDFAGYVEAMVVNRDTQEEEQLCCLRYEEFIALAVNKIQKLDATIKTLEARIEQLEQSKEV